MTLAEWIKHKNWSDQQAAKYFGISRSVVNRLKTGARTPTFDHMARIWVGTKGRVNIPGFMSPEFEGELKKEMRVR